MSLKGKRVVIIGGTSGIGLATAQMAARDGAQVVVASSTAEKVEAAKKQLPAGSEGMTLNVRDEKAIEAFFVKVGKFDHLIYTAGDWPLPVGVKVPDIDIARAGDIFQVRLICALACVKHAIKQIASDGSITLTDGALGGRARKGAPLLAAMAAGNEHMIKALALDLAPIRVNGVAPGGIATPTDDPKKLEARKMAEERLKTTLPIGRLGLPDEVAEAYMYLMKGGYTTGQIMFVDGGGVI